MSEGRRSAEIETAVNRVEIERLLALEEDALYRELGARRLAFLERARGLEAPGLPADESRDAGPLGVAAGAEDVTGASAAASSPYVESHGRAVWQRARAGVIDLLCGEGDRVREPLGAALARSPGSFATVLAAAIVEDLGLMPALAVVVASIVARVAVRSGARNLCAVLRDEPWTPEGETA